MAEYINRDAFLEQQRAWYCKDCNRRKNSKGKFVYEIGEAPCRACDIGTIWFGSINFTKLVGREPIPAMNFVIMAAAITAVITRLIGLW